MRHFKEFGIIHLQRFFKSLLHSYKTNATKQKEIKTHHCLYFEMPVLPICLLVYQMGQIYDVCLKAYFAI